MRILLSFGRSFHERAHVTPISDQKMRSCFLRVGIASPHKCTLPEGYHYPDRDKYFHQ